jgi:hypothetical protein
LFKINNKNPKHLPQKQTQAKHSDYYNLQQPSEGGELIAESPKAKAHPSLIIGSESSNYAQSALQNSKLAQ